jgi:maltooligosyltrehalose trehalohydrolase
MRQTNDMQRPCSGAVITNAETRFQVWAPDARSIEVAQENSSTFFDLKRIEDGFWGGLLPGFPPAALYRYRIDGDRILPDPATRFQPEGVHGPSQVIDPANFVWSDQDWTGLRMEDLVIYELHVGTFTKKGTFSGLVERLPYLADLGITAIELMPVSDFPGRWNWGYDGVDLFAPARCYGTPDELRRMVDECHRHKIGVILDVVYNHFGPDGAYAGSFSKYYYTSKHKTPWGDAINLDGKNSIYVRDFFVQNALYWLSEFHFDGLRLDATHALIDDSPRHFLAELASRVKASLPERNVVLIAEDHRNLGRIIRPESEDGWNLDGVWSDDFHHQMRRILYGDREGYFQDFTESIEDLAVILNKGWFFSGQYSRYFDEPRGTDPSGIPPQRFVFFLQNHDQVGNRAFGERLNHQIDLASYRAASTLLLCVPQTPLLFQGQEWAASTPFCYFTDHEEELGKLVTEGRRQEFAKFSEFSKAENRDRIPDPQAFPTFERSKLQWEEIHQEPHASILRLYKALLELRKNHPAFKSRSFAAFPLSKNAILLQQSNLLVVVMLKDSGSIRLERFGGGWRSVLTTEDAGFAVDPAPPQIEFSSGYPVIHFQRPGTVVLARM